MSDKNEGRLPSRSLAEYLHRFQLLHGIPTRKELAEALNLDERTLRNITRGDKLVSIRTLTKIAKALGVKPYELLEAPRHPDESPLAGPLRVYFDSSAYSAEDTGELLSLISELFFIQAGDRLDIDNQGMAEPVFAIAGPDDGGM